MGGLALCDNSGNKKFLNLSGIEISPKTNIKPRSI